MNRRTFFTQSAAAREGIFDATDRTHELVVQACILRRLLHALGVADQVLEVTMDGLVQAQDEVEGGLVHPADLGLQPPEEPVVGVVAERRRRERRPRVREPRPG